MFLRFKDVCLCFFKFFILILILLGLFHLIRFNYNIGISYCELLNIPKDFALTMTSPGMAIEVAIIMFVLETTIFFLIIKKFKNLKFFRVIFNMLKCYY